MEENSLAYRLMTVGNILDYTFHVYRRNFGIILCFSALTAALINPISYIASTVLYADVKRQLESSHQ
jgi:hypothetical protein